MLIANQISWKDNIGSNCDFGGNDLWPVPNVKNVFDCQKLCNDEKKCSSFSYIPKSPIDGECLLKYNFRAQFQANMKADWNCGLKSIKFSIRKKNIYK